jgi:hypothetical protein
MLLLSAFSCGRPAADPASRLLRQLPAGQAVYLYMDVVRIRSSPSLEPLVRKGIVFPDGITEFANAADLDPLADIDRAAISLGAKGTHLAVEGRFDEAAVRQAIESDGAVCSQSLRSAPCTIPARGSHPELSLSLRAEDLLRVSIGTHLGAAAQLTETGLQRLVVEARDRLEQGAMLWATFEPSLAEQELVDPPAGFGNLRFFARALQKADRGYFYVDELPDGELRITLKANCADSNQADSVSKVLTGLNRLAAAALEAGKGEEPPPEVRVLRAARIVNTETSVVAIWVVDEPTLKAWGGVG